MPTFASRARRISAAIAAVAVGFTGALVAAPAAHAAAFTVTSSADAGVGTLRQAIIDANSGAFPGADTITFDFAIPASSITLDSPIVVTEAINLYGPGVASLQITRSGDFEMLEFDMAAADQDVAIDGIWFDGGLGSTQRGLDFRDAFPVDDLTISDSEFAVFQTTVRGGAVNIEELTGNLIIVGTQFHDNTSTGNVQVASLFAEDIDAGFIVISGSDFEGNTGESGSGIAITYSETADIIIADCTFSDNQSTNAGAAVYIYEVNSLTVRDSSFTNNNVANSSGGSLAVQNVYDSVSIEGSTFSNSDAFAANGGAAMIINVNGLEIIDSAFTNNTAFDNGGAVWADRSGETLVRNSTFTSNDVVFNGGAIAFTDLDGVLQIEQSVFTQNIAPGYGSAVYIADADSDVYIDATSFTANESTNGSALDVGEVSQAPVFVDNSTFSRNVAPGAGAASIGVGVIEGGGTVAIANSTFVEDLPTANGIISVTVIDDNPIQAGQLFFVSSTFVGNGVLDIDSNNGAVFVTHSILDGNANGLGDPVFDVNATNLVSLDHSIVTTAFDASNMDAQSGNLFSTAPLLGALAANGGPTQTMLPLTGSPAINAGDAAYSFPLATDQRGVGFARVVNGRVDIGAVEVQLATLAATGLESSPVLPIGAASLLLLGAAALLFARRRRAA